MELEIGGVFAAVARVGHWGSPLRASWATKPSSVIRTSQADYRPPSPVFLYARARWNELEGGPRDDSGSDKRPSVGALDGSVARRRRRPRDRISAEGLGRAAALPARRRA